MMPMQLDITELLKGGGDGVLPDPELLTYYKNLEKRTFWIDFEISEELLEISRQIILYNLEDKDIVVDERKPIYLYLFSYGGDLASCYSFVDTCKASKTPIVTINMGIAMSATALIQLAGVRRYCLPHSRTLFHSGSAGIEGTYEQTDEAMKDYRKQIAQMHDFIVENSKIDKKLLNRKKSKEWYLTAEEQVECGVSDSIVKDLDEII